LRSDVDVPVLGMALAATCPRDKKPSVLNEAIERLLITSMLKEGVREVENQGRLPHYRAETILAQMAR
jgi:hypothetical protein